MINRRCYGLRLFGWLEAFPGNAQEEPEGEKRTREPSVMTLDSGSHINAHAQRPESEQREPPNRWSVMLGSASLNDLVGSQ